MKILRLLPLFLLFACQSNDKTLSEHDKEVLEILIDYHNMQLQHRYSRDSLKGLDHDKIAPHRKNNIIYNRHLTLEKYLTWCKEHNADPMKEIDFVTASR